MAALTKAFRITRAWTEITAAVGMQNGSRYAIEVQDDSGGHGHVKAVLTDAATPPGDDARGRNLYPRNAAGEGTKLTFTKASERFWYLRSSGADMYVVVEPS
ncbi:MAG: hypothetical protein OXF88_02900 [Rhodobacteraceae bacterium]|nr:hypothetical protein [Paracoccaceae bacterium]